MLTRKSPAEINKEQGECAKQCAMEAQKRSNHPSDEGKMHEHDKVQSRLGGKPREISMGPHGGGLVPSNPFASLLQARFLHAHPEKVGGEKKLEEWDKSTNFTHIPKKVK